MFGSAAAPYGGVHKDQSQGGQRWQVIRNYGGELITDGGWLRTRPVRSVPV